MNILQIRYHFFKIFNLKWFSLLHMSKNKKLKKIFVLDTSVILHDHNSLNCFEENDVAIPITVLE